LTGEDPACSAEKNREQKMTHTYEYPQSSGCSSLILYTRDGDFADMLTTQRDVSVGVGRALSAGGFDEVKKMFKTVNRKRPGARDTYREAYEELGKPFKTIVPYKYFLKNAEVVDDINSRMGNTHIVHKVIFRSLLISSAQMNSIIDLPPTEEQKGKLTERFCLHARSGPVATPPEIRQRLAGFKYPHEVAAAVKWHNKMVYRLAA
jgi:hypothetical protein